MLTGNVMPATGALSACECMMWNPSECPDFSISCAESCLAGQNHSLKKNLSQDNQETRKNSSQLHCCGVRIHQNPKPARVYLLVWILSCVCSFTLSWIALRHWLVVSVGNSGSVTDELISKKVTRVSQERSAQSSGSSDKKYVHKHNTTIWDSRVSCMHGLMYAHMHGTRVIRW